MARYQSRNIDRVEDEPVKDRADWQRDWRRLIQPLPRGKYKVLDAGSLSIHGDAPKCFIQIQEPRGGLPSRRQKHWVGYIAKVGSKFYPVESITEHFITRIGEQCGLRIAGSQLRMVGRQVRFLSRYFLRRSKEQLTHGLEIFEWYLGDRNFVAEISKHKQEKEMYTFQEVSQAIVARFPEQANRIVADLVEMLTFDALIGNNDRHPMNWGVVVPLANEGTPRFSPVFDTARALFWRTDEEKIERNANNPDWFNRYIQRTSPQIGWDDDSQIGHFELIRRILQEFPQYEESIAKFTSGCDVDQCLSNMIDEFRPLLSKARLELIGRCLRKRHQLLCEATEG